MITTSIVHIDARMSNSKCELIDNNAYVSAYVILRLPNTPSFYLETIAT